MKVLFASTNPSKVARFQKELESAGIDVITIRDLEETLDIEEIGKDALENAVIKAKAYYELTGLPTIGMDDTLFIEGIPAEKQPGCFVRRVNGVELSDEEMLNYYVNLVREYGGRLLAKWVYGMAIWTEKGEFTYTWSNEGFYLTDTPSEKRNIRYPLDSISFEPNLQKYYSELSDEEKKMLSKSDGLEDVINFIKKSLNK